MASSNAHNSMIGSRDEKKIGVCKNFEENLRLVFFLMFLMGKKTRIFQYKLIFFFFSVLCY